MGNKFCQCENFEGENIESHMFVIIHFLLSLQSSQHNSSSNITSKANAVKSNNTNINTNDNKPIENKEISKVTDTPIGSTYNNQPFPSTTVNNNEVTQVKKEEKPIVQSMKMNNVDNTNAKTVEEEESKSKQYKHNNSDFSITHVVAANENNAPLASSTNNVTNAKEEKPITCQDLLNVLQGNDDEQEEEKHSIKVHESDNLEYDSEELNKAKSEMNKEGKEVRFSLNQDDDDDEDD